MGRLTPINFLGVLCDSMFFVVFLETQRHGVTFDGEVGTHGFTSRTSILPVTTAVIRAERYSRRRSMASSNLARSESNCSVCLSSSRPRGPLQSCGSQWDSRKGAETQRKSLRGKLCAFAPLRETSSSFFQDSSNPSTTLLKPSFINSAPKFVNNPSRLFVRRK